MCSCVVILVLLNCNFSYNFFSDFFKYGLMNYFYRQHKRSYNKVNFQAILELLQLLF